MCILYFIKLYCVWLDYYRMARNYKNKQAWDFSGFNRNSSFLIFPMTISLLVFLSIIKDFYPKNMIFRLIFIESIPCMNKWNRGEYGGLRLREALESVNNDIPLKTAAKIHGFPAKTLRRHRNNLVKLRELLT